MKDRGIVYNIQRMSVQDGPGIRTTVFLKGCPLRCRWCSNPESQSFDPQLLWFENLCTGCGACMKVCPSGAVYKRSDGKYSRNPAKCTNCGKCSEVCPSGAREISGKIMTVDEVLTAVHRDSLYYRNSGGGVTFGGGEPTAGGDFFLALLQASHDDAFHVTVDTCGFCPEERFQKVIELADLFLFDMKHMNSTCHRELTGQGNEIILKNLKAVFSAGKEVRIRMPLMPELNDSKENIAAMADFLLPYSHSTVEIMPCHMFGRSKYMALGRPLPDVRQYKPEELKVVEERFRAYGLTPVIV